MIDGLQDFLSGIGEDIKAFVIEKPLVTATMGSGIIGAIGLGTILKKRKKRKTAKRKTHARRKRPARKRPLRLRKKPKKRVRRLTPLMKRRKKIIARKGRQTPYTARGGRDTSTRRIRMTKHGQPYVILANGRARFISKASAKRSRKIKGGRY